MQTEKSELKKMMDESYSASRISAIKGQLEKAVTFVNKSYRLWPLRNALNGH